MQNSAGAADKEMEIITNSLTYKLNALRETGTGIWQNLFQRESIGGVVDDLTALLGVVEKFTDQFGLLGTTLGGGKVLNLLFRFFKERKAMADAKDPDMSYFNTMQKAFPAVKAYADAYNESLANGASEMVAFATGAKAFVAALAPVAIAIGIVVAALAAFNKFNYENSYWTRAQESAQKAVTSYQEAKDKLDGLKQEKDDNLAKVQEIAAKYDIEVDGMDDVDAIIEKIRSSDKGITLVDQAELDKISIANRQLETQMKIQEQIENAKRQAAITETENAAQTEKSYWEEIREKHGKGIFGTIASAWEWATSQEREIKTDKDGNQYVDYSWGGKSYTERDTTNIGLAQTAYDELIAKKQELQKLDQEMANSEGGVTQEQIDRHEQLSNEIAEQESKTASLIKTVSDEMDQMIKLGSTSDFSQDYIKRAGDLIRDYTNIDASPAETALNNLNAFFDGTTTKNAIKEKLIEAAKSGEDLESTLRGLGLSLADLDVSDASYLTDYFADLAKQVEQADEEVRDFGKTVSEVEEATKSENSDSDWSTIQAAYKKAGEYYNEGKTGIDDFKAVAQFLSPTGLAKMAQEAKAAGGYAADVYQEAFEEAKSKADRWFGDDEAQSLMNFADDAEASGIFNIDKSDEKGLWDISVAKGFETTAQAADKLGTSVGVVETMLHGLEAYGYDFSGIKQSGEMFAEYGQTLDALNQTYENMAEGEGKDRLNELLNCENGFNKQYEKFEGDLSKLSEKQVVKIEFEYDLASIQSKIDEIQRSIENGMDDDVATHAALISERDKYTETAERGLGLDKEGVVLPVEYELSKQSEQSLKDQLHNTTDKDTRLELQAEIENEQEVQQDILNDFADAHPEITPEMSVEDINKALASTFSDNTIHFTASVDGVESEIQAIRNEDGTITYTADVGGVETEVQPVTNEDGTITYTTEVANEVPDSELSKDGEINYTAEVTEEVPDSELKKDGEINYTANVNDTNVDANKSAKVTFSKDSSAVDNYKATDKQAKVVFQKDSTIPDNYKPTDKQAKVVFGKDSSAPDSYSPSDKHATVNYSANTSGLPTSFSTITRYVNYVKTGAVSVDGTAHANGTAYARGTAFAHGNWGTKGSGVALGGELGQEIVVFISSHIAQ